MEDDAVRPSLPLAALTTVALTVAVLQGSPRASAVVPSSSAAGPTTRVPHVGCGAAARAPRPAAEVERTDPALFATAGRRMARTSARLAARGAADLPDLATLAADPTLELDACGRALYAEPTLTAGRRARIAAAPATSRGTAGATGATGATGARAAATALPPLSETFTLHSRPGASRTIYLDFTGETVAGTAWNDGYTGGAPIVVPPYSTDADTTTFSSADLTEIQRAWQIVAEDYAPFDVDVTTADPGAAALQRSSSTDAVYGARVVVATGQNPVYTGCGCGGVAYVGVFTTSGTTHDYYQPAWVFTAGVGLKAKGIGEAAAHEAGHLFGLNHDGTASASYYQGSTPWAPIMGAGYYQPITQWSMGEYPGANNGQDDVAVIAAGGAPLRTDDVGDTPITGTPLTAAAPGEGVISTRTDVDAWTFTAAGATTVKVASPAYGDLDAQLTVTDALGVVVAVANPPASATSATVATGLGASASFTAPATGGRYTATVDGVGQGSPSTAGGYSDYGSLGTYEISLATGTPTVVAPPPTTAPLALVTSALPAGTVGTPYAAGPAAATGGAAPYRWSATGLPAGVAIDPGTGALAGTPTTPGTAIVVLTATDALGATASSAALPLTVAPAPVIATPLAITTASLPAARYRQAYSAAIVTAGGSAPYRYTWSGSLPSGLAFSTTADGQMLLAGRPLRKGTFPVTLTATDAAGTTTSRGYSIVVR